MTSFVFWVWEKLFIDQIQQAVLVGIGWLAATALFETFILNRKLTWVEIIHTYDLGAGELWGLVLLWIGFLPVFVFLTKTKLQ
jgi:hypothetical protein